MSQSPFDIDELLENIQTWLEAQSMDDLAAYAERLADQVPDYNPLGMVLCVANNQDSLLAQSMAALTAGNTVLWSRAEPEDPVQTQALRVGLPARFKSQVTLTDWKPSSGGAPDPVPQAVLYSGDGDTLAQLQQQAAQWASEPVTIITCAEDVEDDFDIPLEQLQR